MLQGVGKNKQRRRTPSRTQASRADQATPVAGRPAAGARAILVQPGYPDEWRLRLHNVVARKLELARQEQVLVLQALAAGATWSEVGRVLGVTRQSAYKRFRGLKPLVLGPAGQGEKAMSGVSAAEPVSP